MSRLRQVPVKAMPVGEDPWPADWGHLFKTHRYLKRTNQYFLRVDGEERKRKRGRGKGRGEKEKGKERDGTEV